MVKGMKTSWSISSFKTDKATKIRKPARYLKTVGLFAFYLRRNCLRDPKAILSSKRKKTRIISNNIAIAATMSGQLVKIGDESFSIKEIPSSDTALVLKKKDIILGSVDLPALVSDLGRVGNCVRIAYNGVAGYTELQIEIRQIGYNVTKLCDKSAVTVASFKAASESVLGRLKSTYGFLLSGFEKMALTTLKAVTDVAKGMATAADELHKEFDEESKRVEKALSSTMQAKGSEEERKKTLAEESAKLVIDKTKAVQDKETAEEDFQMYEERFRAAEAKQESYEASSSNPLKKIANAVTSPFTRGHGVFDTEGDARRAQEAREEKLKHLEEMSKQRQARSKALRDIAEFAKKLEQCKDDSELADVAIDALHSAIGGLQKLSATMMKAALFWKQVQMHCERLAQERMTEMVALAMEMEKQERIELWKDPTFQEEAIGYYAEWVALDDVCGIYMEKIKETQKELYKYLTENPTLAEARHNVRSLASKFLKELAEEEKAIASKESASQQEMKKIEMEAKGK